MARNEIQGNFLNKVIKSRANGVQETQSAEKQNGEKALRGDANTYRCSHTHDSRKYSRLLYRYQINQIMREFNKPC